MELERHDKPVPAESKKVCNFLVNIQDLQLAPAKGMVMATNGPTHQLHKCIEFSFYFVESHEIQKTMHIVLMATTGPGHGFHRV